MPAGTRRRLAAIMFTDMVGFTAMAQENEAHALRLLERHNQALRPLFPKHHGTEIKTVGDSFLVEFDSALEAAACALEIQHVLGELNSRAERSDQIHVRIGVHLGDVVDSAGDVLGDAVNVASRIEPLAEPDGICISHPVFEQVQNKLDAVFDPLPEVALKNVRYPVPVYSLRPGGTLRIRAPPRPAAGAAHRLAVLPFSNLSPDPQDVYFSDGLTEEMITELSRLPGCQVIARTSVMRYKGSSKGIKEVGRELSVDAALEGSVRKSGNRIRVTAQLIDVGSEAHLWSERFDREMTEIFALQSEIACSVAAALKVELGPHEKRALTKGSTTDLAAFESYLKGRQYWWAGGEENYRMAIGYFEKAIQLDPEFALAYCGLADSHSLLGNHGYVPLKEALATAERFARQALALAPDLADAHVSLAPILYNRYEWAGAAGELRRAIELDPSSGLAHYWLAIAVSVSGDLDTALEIARRGARLDPMSRQSALQPSVFLYAQRDFQGALEHMNEVERRLGIRTVVYRGLCELMLGRTEDALTHLREAAAGDQASNPVRQAFLAIACLRAGRVEEGRSILNRLADAARQGRAPAGVVAVVYGAVGETDRAFEWFERAHEERTVLGAEDLRTDPLLESVRADPRYPELLRKFNL